MGFVGQLLGIKARSAGESVHEKVTQVLKAAQDLLSAMELEGQVEQQLLAAERATRKDQVLQYQKELIRISLKAMNDIELLQVEVFALTEEQKKRINVFISDGQRLMKKGISQTEEAPLIQKLREEQHTISEFYRSTRLSAGFER
jgi:hypothetical protein